MIELYELDIKRGASKTLIKWFIEQQLIDISLLIDDCDFWNGYIWYN